MMLVDIRVNCNIIAVNYTPFLTVPGAACPACTAPPADLVSWWPGDDTGNDISDGNNLTLTSVTYAPGEVADAFQFNGVNSSANAGNPTNLQVSGGDFTVDAWVKFDALTGDMSIVDKMSSVTPVNSNGWRLLKSSTSNQFWFCLGGGSANGCTPSAPTTVISNTVATAGQWYFVTAVKSGADISIYVNGQLENTSSPGSSFTDTNSTDLLIGSNISQSAFMNGLIDEVEIFNRALSAGEIEALFNAATSGKCKPSPTPTPSPTPSPTPVPPTPTPKPPTPTPTSTPTPGPVKITSPASGSTVSGTVTFTCTNPGGSANLYIDDVFVGYSSYSWNTTKFTNGSHYLLCNGYRNGSLIGSAAENVTVSNGAPTPTPVVTPTPKPPTPTPTPKPPTPTPTPKPPTPTPTATPTPGPVKITSPASGSIVSGVVTFTCANPGGSVYLYIDENFIGYNSYSWDTTKFANGSHYLLCNGYRNGSLVGSASENVTVRN